MNERLIELKNRAQAALNNIDKSDFDNIDVRINRNEIIIEFMHSPTCSVEHHYNEAGRYLRGIKVGTRRYTSEEQRQQDKILGAIERSMHRN